MSTRTPATAASTPSRSPAPSAARASASAPRVAAQREVKFITLRRRGKRLLEDLEKTTDRKRIHVPHPKRKFPNPEIHEPRVSVRGYDGELRQIVVRGNGHEKPAFLITNDFKEPAELLVGNYSRRWRVEGGISEVVKFFNLNALSSPILVKVHFDVAMTVIADTLYSMLAQKLREVRRGRIGG